MVDEKDDEKPAALSIFLETSFTSRDLLWETDKSTLAQRQRLARNEGAVIKSVSPRSVEGS
jgi:hypothetical protein